MDQSLRVKGLSELLPGSATVFHVVDFDLYAFEFCMFKMNRRHHQRIVGHLRAANFTGGGTSQEMGARIQVFYGSSG